MDYLLPYPAAIASLLAVRSGAYASNFEPDIHQQYSIFYALPATRNRAVWPIVHR